jgi:hypothetical protein
MALATSMRAVSVVRKLDWGELKGESQQKKQRQ